MKRVLRGKVVSDRMDKTVVVLVERSKRHPIYRKNYILSQKFKAHDEKNEYKVGDLVDIAESRPLSATKRWVVIRKVSAKDIDVAQSREAE